MSQTLQRNFNLLSHHALNGQGNIGEGMSIQIAPDGRRIVWMAHENAPGNVTAVDVSDPRKPAVVFHSDLPYSHLRSNSLETVGNMMAVAYQSKQEGQPGAGFELFDISVPERPKSITFVDTGGAHSRGVHQVWWHDGRYIHMASGAQDFQARHSGDHQFYRIFDVASPSRPFEVGRWWLPGTREGDDEPPPVRHAPEADTGFRVHNTNVYPERPDRAYVGCCDGGMVVLDISDMGHPRMISRWDNSPPYYGFTHTVLPLFERNLFVVTDECLQDGATDWPKLVWIVDARDETNPVPIATCPLRPPTEAERRGSRYGAHNIHENQPHPTSWKSDQVIIGTFFAGGLRAFDISNPYQPNEIAYFVPAPARESRVGQAQLNDVFVDENGIVYTGDRSGGGLYILEMDF